MQENNGVNFLWNILLTLGAIFAIINITRAFKKNPLTALEEYEDIIKEKDKEIAELKKQLDDWKLNKLE